VRSFKDGGATRMSIAFKQDGPDLRSAKGASIFKMMDVSRHKSVDTLRGYVRDAELFKDHAGAGLL
jgi:hypothetical protein